MNIKTAAEILSIFGLSCDFVGGFLLTVEALRLVRIIKTVDTLKSLADLITSSAGMHQPLPLRWPFAIACFVLSILVWLFAPYLLLFTLTPTLFVGIFLLYRFITWSVQLNQTGYIAVVGFVLVSVGYGFQLAGAII